MIWIVLNIIFSIFYFKFLLIYKDGKPKLYKRKYWERMLKNFAKEPILKGQKIVF